MRCYPRVIICFRQFLGLHVRLVSAPRCTYRQYCNLLEAFLASDHFSFARYVSEACYNVVVRFLIMMVLELAYVLTFISVLQCLSHA